MGSGFQENSGYFPSPCGDLYGTLYLPDDLGCDTGIVLVEPFGEEKKCAYRMLVRLARVLAGHGVATLRFDLPGTGDSPGDHGEMDFVAWVDGVRAAAQDCDVVLHLAALIGIPYSYHSPDTYVDTNIKGTLNVLQAARDLGIEQVIHTSTSEVYGTALTERIAESHPLQGQSPYSASKIGADKLAESFYCSYELPVVTVRPFNTYGPRQSARAVIPTIITQAIARNTILLGNTSTIRDFTYVDDTVNGFLCAAIAKDVDGGVFNLGTGEAISIGDLAEIVIQKTGTHVKVEVDAARFRPKKSEVGRLLSDNSLARERLNWQPNVSLDAGLDKTILWVKENMDRFRVGIYER